MELSAIIIILVLSALSLAAIIWMEKQSRQRQRVEASLRTKGTNRTGSVAENTTDGA
jgi:hypothetical protein